MSFSGLLNSLWNSKSDGNKSNNPPPMRGMRDAQSMRDAQATQDIYSQTNINTSVPISQGKEYMLYKQSKVTSVNNEINNFNVNGNQNYNSNSNSNYGYIREGFAGMIGPSKVNTKNQTDSSNRQTMEDEFNRSISSYATSQRNLMDKSQQFLQGKRTYGKNIHALQAANTDDIIPNWVGCYKSGNDGLLEQTDLGNNATLTDCKVRASDLGYSTFALRQKGPSAGNTCFVGDNIDTAQSGGLATKPVLSYAFSKSEDANIGGLLMNGQIGVYEDDITTNLKTDLTALAKCDISIGGQINANTTVATYGYNCNGTAQSPFTAPPPQPAAVIPTPAGYTKYPNKGSGGNDIIKLADGTSLADLAAACDKNANCAGFENSGFIKSAIVPQSQWISMIYNGQVMDLYVKNPKPSKPPTPPTPPVNCAKYGDKDTNLPDECYAQMWKSVCPAPMPDTSSWRTQTKQAAQLNMYEVSTKSDPRLRAMCYTLPPVVKTGSTINTASLWSKPWARIDNGTWANSLSQLNDGTLLCTNGDGNTFLTQNNNISGWAQQTLSIPVKSVIQLQDSRFLGVGKNDNSLYIKDKINDKWQGYQMNEITEVTVYRNNGTVSCDTYCHGIGDGFSWNNELPTDWNGATCVSSNLENNSCSIIPGYRSGFQCKCKRADNIPYLGTTANTVRGASKPDPNTCCVLSIVQLNNGSLIGVGTDNYLYKRNKLTDNWKQIKCPSSCCVTSISKLSDGITLVATGTNGYIYTRQEDQAWTLVDQSMKMSAVTQLKDGRIIGLDQNGYYFSK